MWARETNRSPTRARTARPSRLRTLASPISAPYDTGTMEGLAVGPRPSFSALCARAAADTKRASRRQAAVLTAKQKRAMIAVDDALLRAGKSAETVLRTTQRLSLLDKPELSVPLFSRMLESIGVTFPVATVTDLLEALDTDGNGKLDVDELDVALEQLRLDTQKSPEEILLHIDRGLKARGLRVVEACRDVAGHVVQWENGQIGGREVLGIELDATMVRRLLKKLGLEVRDVDLRRFVAYLDDNSSGTVDALELDHAIRSCHIRKITGGRSDPLTRVLRGDLQPGVLAQQGLAEGQPRAYHAHVAVIDPMNKVLRMRAMRAGPRRRRRRPGTSADRSLARVASKMSQAGVQSTTSLLPPAKPGRSRMLPVAALKAELSHRGLDLGRSELALLRKAGHRSTPALLSFDAHRTYGPTATPAVAVNAIALDENMAQAQKRIRNKDLGTLRKTLSLLEARRAMLRSAA